MSVCDVQHSCEDDSRVEATTRACSSPKGRMKTRSQGRLERRSRSYRRHHDERHRYGMQSTRTFDPDQSRSPSVPVLLRVEIAACHDVGINRHYRHDRHLSTCRVSQSQPQDPRRRATLTFFLSHRDDGGPRGRRRQTHRLVHSVKSGTFRTTGTKRVNS